jgi:hypothetical protein
VADAYGDFKDVALSYLRNAIEKLERDNLSGAIAMADAAVGEIESAQELQAVAFLRARGALPPGGGGT